MLPTSACNVTGCSEFSITVSKSIFRGSSPGIELPQGRIRLPTQETQVQSLGGKDPLKKEMAIHASILAWRIPWTEEPGGLLSMGVTKSRT